MNKFWIILLTLVAFGAVAFPSAGDESAQSPTTAEEPVQNPTSNDAARPSESNSQSTGLPVGENATKHTDVTSASESPVAAPAATKAKDAESTNKQAEKAPPVRVEYRPYKIRVSVAFEPNPAFTRQFEAQTRERMAALFKRSFGLAGELDNGTIEPANWLTPGDFSNLARLKEPEIHSRSEGADLDKQFILVVRETGSRLEIACREWDASLQELGPVAHAVTWDRRELAATAVGLINHLFRPNYAIEDVDPLRKTARLKVRAGGLPKGDSGQKLVEAGDVLVPFFRYYDRNHALQRIQLAPWSYLIVDAVNGPMATCSIVSGLRGALGTGQSRRVEAAAIRAQPMYDETRVKLVLFSNRTKPLPGHQVLMTRKSSLKMSEEVAPTKGVTDRDGQITLTRDHAFPLLWLAVRSGDTLLARVPVVPGLVQETTLELPDDALRLSVERDLDMLKGRLVAVVAQRATQTSRALTLARAGKGPDALKILAETAQLPKIADFESQLNAIRVPAVEAAQKKRDRISESRINRLCTNASDLIRNYLAEDKLRVVEEEIRQLSEIDKPDAKGKPANAPGGEARSK